MLADLGLGRVAYAHLNLWATLLGAAVCVPMGWLIDRRGLRVVTVVTLLLLALAVWRMSAMTGGVLVVFGWVLATRALGQSALSVSSITAVGKSFGPRAGWPMGVYSVLLSVFFAIAFVVVGNAVRDHGWRAAWGGVAMGVAVTGMVTALALREPPARHEPKKEPGEGSSGRSFTLREALRTRVFWVFALAVALFGLVSSGIGLFNEAVLAEGGFSQQTFHTFLAVTTFFALLGQLGCGWLTRYISMSKLLAGAMFLYAVGLGVLPQLRTLPQLWAFAAVFGVAAGFITVIFFAVWGKTFGNAHLGRIQGAAQLLTVVASALGPLLFAAGYQALGSYAPLLGALAVTMVLAGLAAWFTHPMEARGS